MFQCAFAMSHLSCWCPCSPVRSTIQCHNKSDEVGGWEKEFFTALTCYRLRAQNKDIADRHALSVYVYIA